MIQFAGGHPLVDGRQSERALAVRRGVQLLLSSMDIDSVPEFTLPNGRRADLVGLRRDGAIWIVEIKSSLADLRADDKWPDYRAYCDRLYFATLPDIPRDPFPKETGMIVSDALGGEILREAPDHALAAARRKAMLIQLSRHAFRRLHAAEAAHERGLTGGD